MSATAGELRVRAHTARRRVAAVARNQSVRRWAARLLIAALILFVCVEAVRWVSFYRHVARAQDSLVGLEQQLDLTSLAQTEQAATDVRDRLALADADLSRAEDHLRTDPLMAVARRAPVLGTQATGLAEVVRLAHATAFTARAASDVLVAYSRQHDDPTRSAVQEGIAFLDAQSEAMAEVRRRLTVTEEARTDIPGGLAGPLQRRRERVERAVVRMDELVTGYEEAHALAPSLLGFDRPRTYLLLAQNDTELYPSGGLISNYGIVTFQDGQIANMRFEYFVDLFRRWQQRSGNEYVAPPLPLKQYLLRDTSWALGEAGWYPDFPTTAQIASGFVAKGGASARDGTIAIDLRFVEALLRVVGPVTVEDYGGVRVDADHLDEVVLEQTRSDAVLPGSPGKAFLSSLAERLVRAIVATPRTRWPELIKTLGRMGAERHLQLNFADTALQDLATRYGFDGGIVEAPGDYLLLADASVGSTKLNLILENAIDVRVTPGETDARLRVAYTIHNPFDEWRQGRDPQLVRALMLDGVYGSYLRLYAPTQARLIDLLVNGQSVGAQQVDHEGVCAVFGRYTPVGPGATSVVEFDYESAGVVEPLDNGWKRYRLYLQKQAGTGAIPLIVHVALPAGATVRSVTLDGNASALPLQTDLRQDRSIEVEFRTPGR
ncbi:MAG: DUF4012 domain-containing protein [Dehalococcoidia bacterium]